MTTTPRSEPALQGTVPTEAATAHTTKVRADVHPAADAQRRWPRPGPLLLRVLLVSALLLWLTQHAAVDLIRQVLPLLRHALEALAGDFRILSFDFADDRGNRALASLAVLDHVLQIDGRVIVPDGVSKVRTTTTLGNVLQPVLVGCALALAWPLQARGARAGLTEALLRAALLAVGLTLALLLDTPLAFSVRMWHTVLNAHAVVHDSPLLWWNTFLNGGGRLALGLVAGGLAIAGATAGACRLSGRLATRGRAAD